MGVAIFQTTHSEEGNSSVEGRYKDHRLRHLSISGCQKREDALSGGGERKTTARLKNPKPAAQNYQPIYVSDFSTPTVHTNTHTNTFQVHYHIIFTRTREAVQRYPAGSTRVRFFFYFFSSATLGSHRCPPRSVQIHSLCSSFNSLSCRVKGSLSNNAPGTVTDTIFWRSNIIPLHSSLVFSGPVWSSSVLIPDPGL